jgi:hypothetical protein
MNKSLFEMIVGKIGRYWVDDEKRDDFFFRRRILIAFCTFVPISTLNEVYQGHLRVRIIITIITILTGSSSSCKRRV